MQFSACLGHIKRVLGIDRAIAYAVTSRVIVVLGNVGTVLLMVRALSPIEQGYYFTLISLSALQVIFELGFSFVILQLAAHERPHLELSRDGFVAGESNAHARLASVLQLTFYWYTRAALMFGAVVLPLGIVFFSRNEHPGVEVHWLLPWLVTVVACVVIFVQNPLCAFLEGCGEVRQVAGQRLCQSIGNTVLAWTCMATRHGLFAPGMTMMASAVIGTVFLWRWRKLFRALLRYDSGTNCVSWRFEIWPFQWKVAISWLCAYFTMQIFTPMLFHYRGAAEAGQMGMSISIIGYISAIVLQWMTTKASPFGQLVAQREYARLDSLFFRTLQQAMTFLAIMVAGCMAMVIFLQGSFPKLAVRIVAPKVFAVLLVGVVGSVVVQSMAIYLRSFKREPLLMQSVAVATLTLLFTRLTVRSMGTMGVALSYMLCTGFVGLGVAVLVFRSWRRDIEISEVPVSTLAGNEE